MSLQRLATSLHWTSPCILIRLFRPPTLFNLWWHPVNGTRTSSQRCLPPSMSRCWMDLLLHQQLLGRQLTWTGLVLTLASWRVTDFLLRTWYSIDEINIQYWTNRSNRSVPYKMHLFHFKSYSSDHCWLLLLPIFTRALARWRASWQALAGWRASWQALARWTPWRNLAFHLYRSPITSAQE